MTGAYILAIWPPLIAACFLAALSLYSWRRRDAPAALPLAISASFATLWLLGIALEATAAAPAAKIAWFKFGSAWKIPAVTAATCFALEYAYPGHWSTRRVLSLLALPCVIVPFLLAANDGQIVWRSLAVGPGGAVVAVSTPAGALLAAYGYGLALVNLAALLWLFAHSPQHRWPVALMLFGGMAGRGLYALNFSDRPLPAWLDPDVGAILLVWTLYAIALFRFRIFDPLPAARALVIAQMREGMVVLDDRWRVASLNPAAATILSTSEAHASGKTLAELLPACPDLGGRLTDAVAGAPPVEIDLGTGPDARLYVLGLSVLRDFRGPLLGYLLHLSDVTAQRRAQSQLLGQRWAEATLQEREQLAYELHDSLSQSLGFLNVQAQAAQLYLQREENEAASASLARLAEVSRETQRDVRELIGNLLAVSLPSEGFCATLRQVVARFEGQTGLAVHLDIDGPAAALCDTNLLRASTGVQLVRIVQEALANVRKHAGSPSRVSVRLRAEAGQMQLTIEDDGAGFDPALPGDEGAHFGLRVMRQRVARIDGQIAVQSAPGQGTRVEVRVPLEPHHQRKGEAA